MQQSAAVLLSLLDPQRNPLGFGWRLHHRRIMPHVVPILSRTSDLSTRGAERQTGRSPVIPLRSAVTMPGRGRGRDSPPCRPLPVGPVPWSGWSRPMFRRRWCARRRPVARPSTWRSSGPWRRHARRTAACATTRSPGLSCPAASGSRRSSHGPRPSARCFDAENVEEVEPGKASSAKPEDGRCDCTRRKDEE